MGGLLAMLWERNHTRACSREWLEIIQLGLGVCTHNSAEQRGRMTQDEITSQEMADLATSRSRVYGFSGRVIQSHS